MESRSVELDQQLHRAAVLCELRRFADARELLADVVLLHPQSAAAWCLMAEARLGEGEAQEALQGARTAASLAPEWEGPRHVMSAALFRLGEREEAAREAREAVRLAPQSALAHARLARMLISLHAKPAERHSVLAEAEIAAAQALELAPSWPESHLAAGAVAGAAGRRADAEAAFRRALELDPNNSAAHNELARMQLARRRIHPGSAVLASAATGFATAVRADPRAEASRRNLEVTLRALLARVAYLTWLDAFIVAHVGASSGTLGARVLPIAVLGVPAIFAWRFVLRLPEELRDYLWRMLVMPGLTRRAAAFETVAVGALFVGALAPLSARVAIALIAALAGIAARLTLIAARDFARQPGERRFLLSDGVMWILAAGLALFAIVFLLLVVKSRAGVGALAAAGVCAAASAAVVRSLRRRGPSQESAG